MLNGARLKGRRALAQLDHYTVGWQAIGIGLDSGLHPAKQISTRVNNLLLLLSPSTMAVRTILHHWQLRRGSKGKALTIGMDTIQVHDEGYRRQLTTAGAPETSSRA